MAAQHHGKPLTRREMFSRLFRPFQQVAIPNTEVSEPSRSGNPDTAAQTQIAVIAGRHCLAYQGTGCSVCFERCPVNGAIKMEHGLPRVVADACTGCRICHEVCPAPVNAIRLLPRPPGMKMAVSDGSNANAPSPFPHLPEGGGSRV